MPGRPARVIEETDFILFAIDGPEIRRICLYATGGSSCLYATGGSSCLYATLDPRYILLHCQEPQPACLALALGHPVGHLVAAVHALRAAWILPLQACLWKVRPGPSLLWPEASPSFPPPTKAFEGRLQREPIGHSRDNSPSDLQARRLGTCPMDSRLRGNDSLVCERALNFSSRCAAFVPRQSSRQFLDQRFGIDQIFRIEAFGEPIVDRL